MIGVKVGVVLGALAVKVGVVLGALGFAILVVGTLTFELLMELEELEQIDESDEESISDERQTMLLFEHFFGVVFLWDTSFGLFSISMDTSGGADLGEVVEMLNVCSPLT